MLGLINNIMECWITETFGEAVWLKVLEESGGKDTYPWVTSCPVSDSTIYSAITVLVDVMGITWSLAFESFGRYFVKWLQTSEYLNLVHALGSNMHELLANLNHLHLHLGMVFKGMRVPHFLCEKVSNASLELHYFSQRPGLGPFVVGILEGMAINIFNTEMNIKLLHSRDKGHDHEVYLLEFPRARRSSSPSVECLGVPRSIMSPAPFRLRPQIFSVLHPYHIIMDRNFIVLQVGAGVAKVEPGLCAGGHVGQHITITWPKTSFQWSEVKRSAQSPFLLTTKCGLPIKGQIMFSELPVAGCPAGVEVLVFIGSPICSSIGFLADLNLSMSDLPKWWLSIDYMLLAEKRKTDADLLEEYERKLMELKAERDRNNTVIRRIANLLRCIGEAELDPNAESDVESRIDYMTNQHLAKIDLHTKESGVSGVFRKRLAQVPATASTTSRDSAPEYAQGQKDVIDAIRVAMSSSSSRQMHQDDNVELHELLASGAFGRVYVGEWGGSQVAIKVMVSNQEHVRGQMAILELATATSLFHPNVVRAYTYTTRDMDKAAIQPPKPCAGTCSPNHESIDFSTDEVLQTLFGSEERQSLPNLMVTMQSCVAGREDGGEGAQDGAVLETNSQDSYSSSAFSFPAACPDSPPCSQEPAWSMQPPASPTGFPLQSARSLTNHAHHLPSSPLRLSSNAAASLQDGAPHSPGRCPRRFLSKLSKSAIQEHPCTLDVVDMQVPSGQVPARALSFTSSSRLQAKFDPRASSDLTGSQKMLARLSVRSSRTASQPAMEDTVFSDGLEIDGKPRHSLKTMSMLRSLSKEQSNHMLSMSSLPVLASATEYRLIMEYCDLGSLRSRLESGMGCLGGGNQHMDRLETAMDVSKAMVYLHKRDIIHGDVKAQNVLLKTAKGKRGFIGKVCDFGLSEKLDQGQSVVEACYHGTPTHMAPELLLKGCKSRASDVYAFGILLWELYTAESPYKDVDKASLGHHVCVKEGRPVFPACTPPEYKKLAEWCWAPFPEVRPTFEEVLLKLEQMAQDLVLDGANERSSLTAKLLKRMVVPG